MHHYYFKIKKWFSENLFISLRFDGRGHLSQANKSENRKNKTTSSSLVSLQQETSQEQISSLIEWQRSGTTYSKKSLSHDQLTLSRVNWTYT